MPDFREYVRRNLPPLGVSGEQEGGIVEELALELEERYERARRCGSTAAEAWHEIAHNEDAWRELAAELRAALNEPEIEHSYEPPRRESMLSVFVQDLRRDLAYAARQLWKSPAFTTISVLMLALGIGANTAIFSLLNAVLLRNLPVHKPAELVFLGEARAEGDTEFYPNGKTQVFSYPFFRDFARENQVFSSVAAIQSLMLVTYGRIADEAEPRKLGVELVSGTYFPTLGVNASIGRALSPADDQVPGTHPVAVARYAWWRDNSEPKTITIGGTVYSIIGVAPRQFLGVTVGRAPDLWIPLAMQAQIATDRNGLTEKWFQCLHLLGRLKPGMNRARAQANTNLVFHQILRGYLGEKPTVEELKDIQQAYVELKPAATGRSPLRTAFASPLEVLMAVVVLVLLIACANVANLLLARAAARQREMAVRMSMGAERLRLIRQLLAESALLGAMGTALGVAFAWSTSRLLLAMVSGEEILPIRVTPDSGVLAVTIAAAVVTVFLFGTAPAVRATGVDLTASLKTRGTGSGSGRNRLAQGLVVGQVALSLVLLSGAGLFLRSLTNLLDVNVGFERQNAIRLYLDPRVAGYRTDARLSAAMTRIEERVGSLPGVRAAAFAETVFDGGGSSSDDVNVPGWPAGKRKSQVIFDVVGPRYLAAMKMPVLLGRDLSERDTAASPRVAVINETMAREYFDGAMPLGRTFGIGDDAGWQNIEVVGVVKDAKYFSLEEPQTAAAFFPFPQHPEHYRYSFVVRYMGEAAMVLPAVRKAIAEVDPNIAVSDVRPLAALVDDFTVHRRLVAQLSSFFGILAALLAAVGIYGLMSYSLARRTNEFGIRMALGAGRRDVVWVVLRETLGLATLGAAIGLVLTLELSRLLKGLLFGVQPQNPIVIASALAAIITVALVASYLPARRATKIDPATALRWE